MEYTVIKDFKMDMHMSFETGGQSNHSGIIECKNHVLSGKKIFRIVWTPRRGFMSWGKPEAEWSCEVGSKKSYKTLKGLLKSLNLPLMKDSK